ncbi:unnamed protein product [Tilletia controversa]|uniref:Vacuolar protein 14 C-terminal Fig4-binding domain-containing protein n=2 Tax=Tilletia TaxID=13289 RepID=A0A177TIS6_9BASI|nr:hypothetical protein CF336_g7077 [Tilletia laevis]KAE8244458.1 hypothetical protein A4X03_0g7531 [Tilletia caries]CAD6911429.1 unnamed protein product [Tilletia controversa]KAE8187608.1 hypothetical protein CF335_g7124 [Tilletia laevis]CAD6892584.1 unnamed protein product [Tilletia caries]
MDPILQKALLDRAYEKRKQATLDLERQVRECLARNELARVDLIVHQLCALLASSSPHNLNARNGGLIGLAGIAIALGVRIAPYLEQIVPPVLACFADPDNKIRYFACESFYNIAKVCKGEILIFFNDIFDALSKLAADSELSVKNGAELLDRLMKDIVCEAAPHYVSQHQDIALIRARQDQALGRGNLGGEAEMDIAREKTREAAWLLSHPYSAESVIRRGQGLMPASMENRAGTSAGMSSKDRGLNGGQLTAGEIDRELEAHTQTMTSQHAIAADSLSTSLNRAFSLARFIPLLAERLYVLSPFTRNFLVGWITTLDSVPDLELVSYLPRIFDPLLKYLSDPNMDVRVATKGVLGNFLQEAKEAASSAAAREAEEKQRESRRRKREQDEADAEADALAASVSASSLTDELDPRGGTRLPRLTPDTSGAKKSTKSATSSKGTATPVDPEASPANRSLAASSKDDNDDGRLTPVAGGPSMAVSASKEELDRGEEDDEDEVDDVDVDHQSANAVAGAYGVDGERSAARGENGRRKEKEQWIPKQEIRIDYAAVMDILIGHIADPDEEIQATTLQWIAEFLLVIKSVVLPFTPRLIPAILPNLAHHSPAIQHAAQRTNDVLYRTILELPNPDAEDGGKVGDVAGRVPDGNTPRPAGARERERSATISSPPLSPRLRMQPLLGPSIRAASGPGPSPAAAAAAAAGRNLPCDSSSSSLLPEPFDYHSTVNALTLQLLDEHEETRVTALQWLLMLHTNAPRKILAMDDGTFPALLKTLSDPSEEVIRQDLRLLAQISSASEDEYFFAFMRNLLNLFATDRRLLETRGSLIIRQLCASLNTDRIMRTLAEILERDEDAEFASIMVTNLMIIIITAPELADFRRRLKSLDTRDGQLLFTSIYKSWCHNAVATFTLCLLAGAYEHAFNLLQIFASELEITVPLLVQIDKLVQLLESPIFTSLRLQLLEPEKHPFLFKCLYGLLMLLPQSSAFVTLRNRLNAVSTMGFVHVVPRAVASAGGPGNAVQRGGSSSALGPGGGSGSGAGVGSSLMSSSNASGGGGGGVGSSTGKMFTGGHSLVRWNELLSHFRAVQIKHERLRRQNLGMGMGGQDSAGNVLTGQQDWKEQRGGGGTTGWSRGAINESTTTTNTREQDSSGGGAKGGRMMKGPSAKGR